MGRDLPTGVVTLLFTDVEGSTRLLHEQLAAARLAATTSLEDLTTQALAGHATPPVLHGN
jgi:class 3 adenylate cyclase